jgi:hypothetical protein
MAAVILEKKGNSLYPFLFINFRIILALSQILTGRRRGGEIAAG